jgi:hypothetical protein
LEEDVDVEKFIRFSQFLAPDKDAGVWIGSAEMFPAWIISSASSFPTHRELLLNGRIEWTNAPTIPSFVEKSQPEYLEINLNLCRLRPKDCPLCLRK